MPVKKELTELERLDLAARGEAIEPFVSHALVPLSVLSLVLLLLALGSEASSKETIAIGALVILAIVTTVMIWRRWCYALYGLSILNFCGAIHILMQSKEAYSRTFLSSAHDQFFFVLFASSGVAWWKNAAPFISAQSEELEKERRQVGQWLSELKYRDRAESLVEFSEKSFLNGHWTYRVLDTGHYWAIAKFQIGNIRRLANFTIQDRGAIHAADCKDGGMKIEIAGRSIRAAEVSPHMRDRILNLVNGNMK